MDRTRHAIGWLVLAGALLAAWGIALPLRAETRTWTGADDDDWFNAANWDPSGLPAPTDDLTIDTGTPETDEDVTTDDGGSITVRNGVPLTLYDWADLVVGDSGTGTLTIEAGGQVSNDGGFLGKFSGSTGTATVTGAGSTWTNSQYLYVGLYGAGTLTVSDGGLVTAETLYASLGDLYGDGTIEAHGAVLDADLVFDSTHGLTQSLPFGTSGTLNLDVDGTGALGAGYKRTGTLRIAEGRSVTSIYGEIGLFSGSTATATVTGAGSTWTTDFLNVGEYGTGTLIVEAGGHVSNWSGDLGRGLGSTGTATVTGEDSTWQSTENLCLGGTDTTDGGDASLTVEDGGRVYVGDISPGQVNVPSAASAVVVSDDDTTGGELLLRNGAAIDNDGRAYLAYKSGDTGTATVTGEGSTWTNSQWLTVGGSGTGTLTVEGGGQVSSENGYLAYQPGSTGTATVTGEGSTWTNSDHLTVGDCGSGTLTIEAGGQVSDINAYLGCSTGSSGTATVTGVGSTWTNAHSLYVGRKGMGTLTVSDGGLVTAETLWASLGDLSGDGTIEAHGAVLDADLVFDSTHGPTQALSFGSGGTLNLTVDGSSLLGAGYKGTGTLCIAEGRTLASDWGCLGYRPGSNGTATVNGAGSTWTNSDILSVGLEGVGSLIIQNGGQVNGLYGYIGHSWDSTGTATVTGEGSAWANTWSLQVGWLGAGTLTIEAGGQVSNSDGCIGRKSDSAGTTTVTGVGSTWTNSYSLYVGHEGDGTLTIEAGGQVSNRGGYLGYWSDSTGTATVTGDGSTWTNTGSLYVGGRSSGPGGTGELTVAGGGTVDVAETLKIWDDGTVNLQDGGTIIADCLDNTSGGTFNLTGGTLSVAEFLGDFQASGGNLEVAVGEAVDLAGVFGVAAGATFAKTGDGLLVISGEQDHGTDALLEVLAGTVEMHTDASGTGQMDDADLSILVTNAQLDFGHDQHLDTLEIDGGGLVRLTGAGVVVVRHLVMNGVDLGGVTLTPEPATLALLAAGGLALLNRRRRA